MAKTVTGRKSVWQILETVGKGDAGEVLRVQTALGREQGVMKRPVQNVSGGTIVRQAMQIENEGMVLALLDGLNVERHGRKVHTPLLLDQSIEGTSSTANLFIVSEEVSGVSISELLRRKLQGGSPISQVIVLSVLAAAFQLLQKVHEKGVIWNDVKMDHIFWDAQANTLSFIDWGNSLNLNRETNDNNVSPMLDYQQLLEEGRALIEQTSPELIADIGWPLSASNLNDQEINHLQMRVEYMETYLSMRVIEYKLLFGRYLKSMDSLDGLKQTLELMRALQKLGVEVNTPDLLSASQKYLLEKLDQGDNEQANEAYLILEEQLDHDLSPNWQIGGYLLKQFGEKESTTLARLLHAVFENDWTNAAWIFRENFLAENVAPVNDPVLNSMRTIKLISNPYPPISSDLVGLHQQSARWLETALQKNLAPDSINTLQSLTDSINKIILDWELLKPGEKLGDKFLLLRQLLDHISALQLRPATNLQTSILAAMSRIRDIYRAWAECDLVTAQKQTRELFLLEPSLVYLPALEADFSQMIDWLETLNQGPSDQQAVNQFASELLGSLPPLAERLGDAPWLTTLLHAIHSMEKVQAIDNLREEARLAQWPLGWLDLQSLHVEIPEEYRVSVRLDATQLACLEAYHHALKTSLMPSDALKKIRQHLPAFHQGYSELAAGFGALFSQLHGDAPLPSMEVFPQEDQQRVRQVLELLETVRNWKQHIRSGSPAAFLIPEILQRDWSILGEIHHQDENWRKQILPKLSEIKQKRWKEFPLDLPAGKNDPFMVSRAALAKLQLGWKRIPEQGLYREMIQEMIYQIDTAQANFFQFWQSLQRSESVVTRWLCGNYQANFSEINQSLLKIAREMRGIELAHNVVNQPEMARTRTAQNSAGDLMFTLVQLDEQIMPQTRKPSTFRSWHQQFLELLKKGDRASIVEGIQTIEAIHPLLPWFDELVRRDADYFDLPKSHQW